MFLYIYPIVNMYSIHILLIICILYLIILGIWTHYDTIIYPDDPQLLLGRRIICENVSRFLQSSGEPEIEEVVPDKGIVVRRISLGIHLVIFHTKIVTGNIFYKGASELAYICREIVNIYDEFCSQTVEIHHHNDQQKPEYRDLKIDQSSLKEVNVSNDLINRFYIPLLYNQLN